MAYWGNEPAKVAVKVGSDAITTTQIEDGQVYTADLQDDAVTANKVDDDGTGFRMGSLGLGTAVSGSHKLTVGGTATFSGDITGTLATASQPNITSVGTIGTGVWEGTPITSAYLNASQTAITSVGSLTGLTIDASDPILTLKSDGDGNANTGYVAWQSNNGTSEGWLGYGSTGDSAFKLYLPSGNDHIEFLPNATSALTLTSSSATFTGKITQEGDVGLGSYAATFKNTNSTRAGGVLIDTTFNNSGLDEPLLAVRMAGTSIFNVSSNNSATFAGTVTVNNSSHSSLAINSPSDATASWTYYKQNGTLRWATGREGNSTNYQIANASWGVMMDMEQDGDVTFAKAVTIGDSSGSDELLVQGGSFPVARINNMGGGETGIRFRSYENGSNQLHVDIKAQETGNETGTFKIYVPHSTEALSIDHNQNATFAGLVKTGKIYTQEGNGTIDGSGNGDGSLVDTPYTVTLDMPEGSHILTATMGRTEVHMIATYLIHCAPYASSVINCSVTQLAKNAYGGNGDITVTNQNNSTAFGFNSTSAGEIKITFINDDSTSWQYWDWSYICLNNK